MSTYMKFFTPSKKSVTDPNGGMINYPEICIDTNPRFEHKLTAHEIIILDQAAEMERYETARQEDAPRLEQVKRGRDAYKRIVDDVRAGNYNNAHDITAARSYIYACLELMKHEAALKDAK